MVINNETSVGKYALGIVYIVFNCLLYISSGPTLLYTWKSSTVIMQQHLMTVASI